MSATNWTIGAAVCSRVCAVKNAGFNETHIEYNILDNKKSRIDVLGNQLLGRRTILSNQVSNLLKDQILFRSKSNRECLRNKAADVPVNIIPAARSDMRIHNLQNSIFRHVTTACPENVIQDYSEVYDVAHHASDILLAGKQEEIEQLVGVTFRSLLTCPDIHRKPNP